MDKYIPKVGDKVFGFDYKQTKYNTLYDDDMDFYVGKLGVVSIVHGETFLIKFDDDYWWYPTELAHLALKPLEGEGVVTESEIDWQVGQKVYCVLHGSGVVQEVLPDNYSYPVKVDYEGEIYSYTKDGKIHKDHKGRVLFFSEPEITAEKFPPKKPFTPTLESGDIIFVVDKYGAFSGGKVVQCHAELEDRIVTSEEGHYFLKKDLETVRLLWDEVKF